jgi:hypothetical protein
MTLREMLAYSFNHRLEMLIDLTTNLQYVGCVDKPTSNDDVIAREQCIFVLWLKYESSCSGRTAGRAYVIHED